MFGYEVRCIFTQTPHTPAQKKIHSNTNDISRFSNQSSCVDVLFSVLTVLSDVTASKENMM